MFLYSRAYAQLCSWVFLDVYSHKLFAQRGINWSTHKLYILTGRGFYTNARGAQHLAETSAITGNFTGMITTLLLKLCMLHQIG